jgi:L-cysteine:1D-myo-inositol 2-amino-2-deoxy-alpha-D-glucopyranoside ligase
MYVCGITPYDATHMGHAATYVAFDLLHRAWRDAGHDVHYVQNITDVDDPLLVRAVETGQDWAAIAARETALFREDMEALRVLPPRDYLGVVEAMPTIVRYIQALQDRGAVYSVEGDLYFDVSSDVRFGSVCGMDEATMVEIFAERGGDPRRPGKLHPLDPLVWLAARDGEPSWESELGRGRPGWHIECVAIAVEHIGMSFDVQGGGSDLIFPHHQMCASQAQVLSGEWPFARSYVHAGMVGLDGHKMSKSRGNLVFVSRLREAGKDPMAIRLALLAHHYRSDWEWTPEGLQSASERLGLWRRATALSQGPDARGVVDRMREVLSDDLNAPAALAAIDRWCGEALEGFGTDLDSPGLIRRAVDSLLGIDLG